ncbi:MAG: hypothetical protein FJW32_25220 [Acidobacteria bacterium]|nr:hypothetical protein [Acidobacteriota bacterium]
MPSKVIPGLHFKNARKAIDWLCEVFGFDRHAVYAGRGNQIHHAELTLNGEGMIMLGSIRKDMPAAKGSINLIVNDPDAIYKRAVKKKAKIIVAIEDKPYGGRAFACEDLEGNTWHIGNYDPWTPK